MSGGMGGGEAGVAEDLLTTKGDTHGFSTENARVAIGSNTQVLTADSTEALGLKWATPTDVAPPTTTKGDLSGFSTSQARIPISTNGTVLTADSTEALGLKWAALPSSSSTLELLDIHIATGVESSYTFTPASPLLPADYQEFWVFIKGESTLAYDLQLILNGVTATYQYNGWRNSNGTSDINDKGVNAAEYKIYNGIMGGSNADFDGWIRIVVNGIAGSRPSFHSVYSNSNDLTHQRMWGTNSGTAATTLVTMKLETSTSTWKAGTSIRTYGILAQ